MCNNGKGGGGVITDKCIKTNWRLLARVYVCVCVYEEMLSECANWAWEPERESSCKNSGNKIAMVFLQMPDNNQSLIAASVVGS